MSSLLSYVFASPFCRISCHFISCFLRMQSRNTDELHDGFSSLLRVFDVGTSFYFLHAQKQLQPAPTLGTLTWRPPVQEFCFFAHAKSGCGRFPFRNAVPQPLCCSFLFCKFFLFPLKQNHHSHQCGQKIRNRLGGNNTGKTGKF